MKDKYIKIRLNTNLRGFLKGKILKLGNGCTQLDAYWRKRLIDSQIDNCLTIIDDNANEKETKKEKKMNSWQEKSNQKVEKKLRAKNVNK